MTEVAAWWVTQLAVGAAGLLPAAALFGGLPSRGVAYARPLAWALLALGGWLAVHLTPLAWGTGTAWALLGVLGGWSAWLAIRRPELRRRAWEARRRLLATEVLFGALFVVLVILRAQTPEAAGTEKPMDLGILVSVHRSGDLPPADPWFAGQPVAYHHLGHVGADLAGRLGGTGPAVTFTLALPLVLAAATVAVWALAGDIATLGGGAGTGRRWWAAGAVGAAAFLLLAPLEGVAELLAAHGIGGGSGDAAWRALGVEGFPDGAGADGLLPAGHWWWWRASRVLPGMITEFPAFSLLLGDVHAHVLALPGAVLVLALATTLAGGLRPLAPRAWLRDPPALLAAAAIPAALVMTSAWDGGPAAAVLLPGAWIGLRRAGWRAGTAAILAVRGLAVPAALAALLAWPFVRTLEPVVGGIAPVTGAGSDPLRFALVWLPLALLPAAAIVRGAQGGARGGGARGGPLGGGAVEVRTTAAAAAVGGAAVLLWAAVVLARGDAAALTDRGAGWVTLAILVGAAAAAAGVAAAAARRGDGALTLGAALTTAWAALVLGTELWYVVDAFDTRMVTVFKAWYAGWLWMAVAAGALAPRLWERRGAVDTPRRPAPGALRPGALRPSALRPSALRPSALLPGVLLPGVLLLLVAAALYLPAAAASRAREPGTAGLDALAFLDHAAPETAALVRAAAALPRGSVLVEATGPSYGAGGRISAFSGTPAVLGWPGHEVQWRDRGREIAARQAAISHLYTTGDVATARALGATHVVVGPAERARYGEGVAVRFSGWPVVARAGAGLLLAVPGERPPGRGAG